MGGYETPPDRALPPAAALLRRPQVLVRKRVLDGLREAGFDDVLPAHLGVFQHPGPENQRPGVLAARTQSSKQAMNHLLHQLEELGYLVRESHPTDGRNRLVRLTARGHAASKVIHDVLAEVDAEWAAALGARQLQRLQRLLLDLDSCLDALEGVRR